MIMGLKWELAEACKLEGMQGHPQGMEPSASLLELVTHLTTSF